MKALALIVAIIMGFFAFSEFEADRGGDFTEVLPLDKKTDVDFHEVSPLPNGVIFTVHHTVSRQADTIEAWVNGQRTVILRQPGESLRRPIYSKTTNYGHFGKSDPALTWERTDKVAALRKAL